MDFLPNLDTLSSWLLQYGSISLFVLLTLGIIILPIPEETLMMVAGALMRHDKLNIAGTFIAAAAGSICGISVSYLIGKSLGAYCITKYGKWIGITEKRLEKTHKWFERFGKWALFFGYFIPGVRHFTGVSAGVTKLEYKQFALFAYSGAVTWVLLFLSSGYFFGHCSIALYEKLELTADKLILYVGGFFLIIVVSFITFLSIKKALKKGAK